MRFVDRSCGRVSGRNNTSSFLKSASRTDTLCSRGLNYTSGAVRARRIARSEWPDWRRSPTGDSFRGEERTCPNDVPNLFRPSRATIVKRTFNVRIRSIKSCAYISWEALFLYDRQWYDNCSVENSVIGYVNFLFFRKI